MADISDRAAAAARDIRAFAEERLRDEFPYMKTDTLDQLLAKIVSVSLDGVVEQTREMKDTLQRSSLFSLSAELRNAIYEEVLLEEEHPINMQDDHVMDSSLTAPPIPSLLHVSQQVRCEAAPIYYGANTFWACAYPPEHRKLEGIQKPIRSWLELIGPKQCGMIKNLFFDLGHEAGRRYEMNDFVKSAVHRYRRNELEIPSRRKVVTEVCNIDGLGVHPGAVSFRSYVYDEEGGSSWEEADPVAVIEEEDVKKIEEKLQWGIEQAAQRDLGNRNRRCDLHLIISIRLLHTTPNHVNLTPADMDVDQTATTVSANLREFAEAEFRKQYPYMKDATLKKLLDKLSTTCHEGLIEQEPEHKATKARINFFSLSAELRNRIYEHALNPIDGGNRPIIEKRPSLLAVNRQVRNEALSIYYATPLVGRVYLHGTYSDINRIRRFFKIIGAEQAAMISRFVLVIEYEELPLRRLSKYIKRGSACSVKRRSASRVIQINNGIFLKLAEVDMLRATLVTFVDRTR
ncbi:hypothetical protein HII31_03581 [Pseudocercospora fuligena]|uniref:Uncharacterized protein n=1 Tax=Pseudocercospora fuligena TaxID=685502 RepID=A0A8H6RQL3_9PEZI|nr:hypothetical protein HII31_03581 [Pseudocercospora fuligena]